MIELYTATTGHTWADACSLWAVMTPLCLVVVCILWTPPWGSK